MDEIINKLDNLTINESFDELTSQFETLKISKDDVMNKMAEFQITDYETHADELTNMMSKLNIDEIVVKIGFNQIGKLKFSLVSCQTAYIAANPFKSLPYVNCF